MIHVIKYKEGGWALVQSLFCVYTRLLQVRTDKFLNLQIQSIK